MKKTLAENVHAGCTAMVLVAGMRQAGLQGGGTD